jgi:hypothetical protein
MDQFEHYQTLLYYRLGGTKPIVKAAHIANVFKAGTTLYLIFLMVHFD